MPAVFAACSLKIGRTMKTVIGIGIILLFTNYAIAQRACKAFEYEQQQVLKDPAVSKTIRAIEEFTQQQVSRHSSSSNSNNRTNQTAVIIIPVVIHILYHYSGENFSKSQIQSQIDVLNRDFRKRNADTVNTPAVFKSLAADCQVEFQLATVDPLGRATTGIIHQYTPVTEWIMEGDKIKLSSEMGSDAWDSKSYLNIWIGNLKQLLGYASFPGGPAEKDGIVLNTSTIGSRILVHEAGHWLNLKHTWGETECGDDFVDDTPKQRGFTPGCPAGIRISCGNAPQGDMYMNYMDFTNDACLNMFTYGQKERMRSLFLPGGARYSMLSSNGLGIPLIEEISLSETGPKWVHVNIYPNPTTSELSINFEYDTRWIGKEIFILNVMGQIVKSEAISSKVQKIDISGLKSGIYIIRAQKNGEKIIRKFVKM
ncbi:MAG: M43 family zinc metalloprotease [Bacteroidota bacterium]|nr:M43 family zinc metalloprotease [Bacteroidota bacterium]